MISEAVEQENHKLNNDYILAKDITGCRCLISIKDIRYAFEDKQYNEQDSSDITVVCVGGDTHCIDMPFDDFIKLLGVNK